MAAASAVVMGEGGGAGGLGQGQKGEQQEQSTRRGFLNAQGQNPLFERGQL